MSRNNKYSNKKAFTPLFVCIGFALLIFSSCVVRKTIQAYLDVPVTESLNKLKTTLPASGTCQLFEETISAGSLDNTAKFSPYHFYLLPVVLLFLRGNTDKIFFHRPYHSPFSATGIPLFILYRQMKIFA